MQPSHTTHQYNIYAKVTCAKIAAKQAELIFINCHEYNLLNYLALSKFKSLEESWVAPLFTPAITAAFDDTNDSSISHSQHRPISHNLMNHRSLTFTFTIYFLAPAQRIYFDTTAQTTLISVHADFLLIAYSAHNGYSKTRVATFELVKNSLAIPWSWDIFCPAFPDAWQTCPPIL